MAPVLGYWNIRGLAAPIRYLLEHVGEDYEWKGYEFSQPEVAKNDKDAVEQDMVDGVIWDLIMRWAWLCYGTQALEKDKADYRTELLIPILKQLEQHLHNREYCVGDYLTYTDFMLYERLDGKLTMFPDILDDFPSLKFFTNASEI